MSRIAAILSLIPTLVSCTSIFCNPQADPATSKQPVYGDREGYAVLSELLNQTMSKSKVSAIDISRVTAQEEEFIGFSRKKQIQAAFSEGIFLDSELQAN
jgi:hypothetical protein